MAIITRDGAKAALGISGTAQDARIDSLLGPVSAAVEAYAGRAFEQAEVTERHFGRGCATIFLPRTPVASVASVVDSVDGSTVASSQYAIDAAGALRRAPYGASWESDVGGNPRYQITYTGGPSSPPDDAVFAAYEILQAALTGMGGLSSEKDGDYSYTSGQLGIPAAAMAYLDRYRASPI